MQAAPFSTIFTACLQTREHVFLTFIHAWNTLQVQWLEISSEQGVRNQEVEYGFISYSPWVYLVNGWNPDICCGVLTH